MTTQRERNAPYPFHVKYPKREDTTSYFAHNARTNPPKSSRA